jgi:hypothetical protein
MWYLVFSCLPLLQYVYSFPHVHTNTLYRSLLKRRPPRHDQRSKRCLCTSKSLNKAEGEQTNRFADLLARAEKSTAEAAASGEKRRVLGINQPRDWSKAMNKRSSSPRGSDRENAEEDGSDMDMAEAVKVTEEREGKATSEPKPVYWDEMTRNQRKNWSKTQRKQQRK